LPGKHREEAHCPRCGSLERHRLAHRLLRERIDLGETILHVTLERPVAAWLRRSAPRYISADLSPGRADRCKDLTALTFDAAAFTLLWCSHVLEHIEDDAAAMAEMHRVLRPGGRALVQVPIWRAETHEDCSITDPEERLKHFKQRDHVRLYGLDIIARLGRVGFAVETLYARDPPQREVQRAKLSYVSTNQVFVCTKAA
jgi:SAM-dependent methyltransferase